jgi:phospholipase/carboxylesterase
MECLYGDFMGTGMRRCLYVLLAVVVGGAALCLVQKGQRFMYGSVFSPANRKPPKKLVIVMHGYGSNAGDLWTLGREISKTLPDVEVHVPHGFDSCEVGGGGYQWFRMGNWTIPEWKEGLAQTKTRFDAYLEPLIKKYHLSRKDVALVGFSQGAMMALHFGIQQGVQAIVSFSGILVDPEVLEGASTCPNILLIHGDADDVLPVKAFFQAQEVLRTHQVSFETLLRPDMGHIIDTESLQKACTFLKEHLAS